MTDTPAANVVETREDRYASEQKFVADLTKRLREDNGKAANLRRNAGSSTAEARGIAWLHGMLRPWGEEAYFMIATLFASDKEAIEGKNRFKGDFGATLHALRSKSAKQSDDSPFDRRFNILLDADFDAESGGELAYRLRQMTKMVIAQRDPFVRIDWPQLLYDVKQWNHPKKWVQKKWARSYYAPSLEKSEQDQPTLAE